MERIPFSVVMSVYQGDKNSYFEKSVESLLNQTYPPSEIIIVVDGKVDKYLQDSISSYKALENVNLIYLNENLGLANALNIGMGAAKYDIIARMDSDDICFLDRFEKQIPFFKNSDIDILGGQILEFGNNVENIVSKRVMPKLNDDMVKFMRFRSPFSHPTIVMRKCVFEACGGYDSSIFPEDYDFFVRAHMSGFKFENLDEFVLWFRLGTNLTETLKRRWGLRYAINEFTLYRKFLRLGFFNYLDFLLVLFFKIPMRLLPFSLYRFLYFKILR